MKTSLLLLTVATLALALPGCVTPDPLFLQNARKIGDTAYPANKIVGTWVHFIILPVQTPTLQNEAKTYLDLWRGGRGKVREVHVNRATGGHLSAEASIRWTYDGGNWWIIHLPATAAYRVTDSHLMRMGGLAKPATEARLRYFDGNLYDFDERRVLVPATAANVKAMTDRMRRNTPVLFINQR